MARLPHEVLLLPPLGGVGHVPARCPPRGGRERSVHRRAAQRCPRPRRARARRSCSWASRARARSAPQARRSRLSLMQVGETFRSRSAASGRGVELVRVVTGGSKPEKLIGKSLQAKATKAVTVASATAWMGKVSKGQSRAAAALASAAARCPNQQIVLAGYSQGATALHRSLASFQSTYGARLIGAILVGDADKVRGTKRQHRRCARRPAPRPRPGHPRCSATPRRARHLERALPWSASARRATSSATCAATRPARRSPCTAATALVRAPRRSRLLLPPCGRGSPAGHEPPSPACRSPPTCRSAGSSTADVDPAYADSVEWSQVSGLPAGASISATGLLTGPALAEGSWTVSYAVRTTNPPSPLSYGSFVLTTVVPEPIVSAGGQSTCEVRADTTLWCWGNDAYGQVGDGQTKDRTNPQQIGTAGLGPRQLQRRDELRRPSRPDALVLGHEPPRPARHR